MKILTVEDDRVSGMLLESTLRQMGHELVSTKDGEEAWALFQADPLRVVVSDWNMPQMDGLELCRRIRQRGGDYTYFILLTNRSTTRANREAALQAGVDDFLSKPLKSDELWMRLHVADRILNYATKLRQLEALIPICSYCRKVRDDKNFWEQIENYINSRTGSRFSHGVCPHCYEAEVIPQMRAAGITPPPYPQVARVKP